MGVEAGVKGPNFRVPLAVTPPLAPQKHVSRASTAMLRAAMLFIGHSACACLASVLHDPHLGRSTSHEVRLVRCSEVQLEVGESLVVARTAAMCLVRP